MNQLNLTNLPRIEVGREWEISEGRLVGEEKKEEGKDRSNEGEKKRGWKRGKEGEVGSREER